MLLLFLGICLPSNELTSELTLLAVFAVLNRHYNVTMRSSFAFTVAFYMWIQVLMGVLKNRRLNFFLFMRCFCNILKAKTGADNVKAYLRDNVSGGFDSVLSLCSFNSFRNSFLGPQPRRKRWSCFFVTMRTCTIRNTKCTRTEWFVTSIWEPFLQ